MLFFHFDEDAQFLKPRSDEDEWPLDTPPLKQKFFLSTYALQQLAEQSELASSLDAFFDLDSVDQLLSLAIYQIRHSNPEDHYNNWAYHQILPEAAQRISRHMIRKLFHQCDERAWKAFWNQRWASIKGKRRRAGDNTPIRYAVLLSSVKEAHLATVIDLWQAAVVYAFVDNGTPSEEEKYEYLLQRLQDLGFNLDQLLLVPAQGELSILEKQPAHFLHRVGSTRKNGTLFAQS